MARGELVLAFETSGQRGSVALARAGGPVAFRWLPAERTHTSELMPTVQELLRELGGRAADIGLYAYSSGPGSFTGLRIAATVGRMLGSATGCAVVAVPTLEVIARNALRHPRRPERLVPILDAKRGQVYGAVYRRGRAAACPAPEGVGVRGWRRRDTSAELEEVVAPGIFEPASWLAGLPRPFAILGPGAERHRQACVASGGGLLGREYWPPSAEHVVTVGLRLAGQGRFCAAEQITPLYLRPPECEEVYDQRRAAARRRRGE